MATNWITARRIFPQILELIVSKNLQWNGPLYKIVAIFDRNFLVAHLYEIKLLYEISLKFVLKRPSGNRPAFINITGLSPNRWQTITWNSDNHSLLTYTCVTEPK